MKVTSLLLSASVFALLAIPGYSLSLGTPPTNITVSAGGSYLQNGVDDPDLSLASNAFYSSFVGGTSNSKASNLKFLQGVIGNWNNNNGVETDLLVPNSSDALPADNGSIGNKPSFIAPSGYLYVVFHFGGGNANASGPNQNDEKGWWAAWYLGGEGATFSLPQEGDPLENVGGFSSARFFGATSVPDGGTTMALLGLALLALALVSRRGVTVR